MKKIPLTKGEFALVDDEDFDYLGQWKWHLSDGGYAKRNRLKGEVGSSMIRMHRVINKTPKNLFTDHINGNKLDNRKCNLRNANKSLNGLNRGKNKNNTSGRTGVSWNKRRELWESYITYQRKKINLGIYADFEEALNVRKAAELKYFGFNKE